MPTIISIKTSQSNNTPTALANGELAYSYSSNKLYIGQTDTSTSAVSVEYIGGKLIVDKVANLESQVSAITGGSSTHSNVTITNVMTISNATNNAVLFAKAGGIVDYVTGTSGQILQIAANSTPTFDDLDGGNF